MPSLGSWQEAICLLVWTRRQGQEHSRTRAVVQAILKPKSKEAVEAFQEYVRSIFPFEEEYRAREREKQMEVMKEWTSGPPMAVKALQDLTPKRTQRLKKRLEDIDLEETPPPLGVPTRAPKPLRTTAGSTRRGRVRRSARRPKRGAR